MTLREAKRRLDALYKKGVSRVDIITMASALELGGDDFNDLMRHIDSLFKQSSLPMSEYIYTDRHGNQRLDVVTLTADLMNQYQFLTLEDTEEVLVYRDGYYQNGGEVVIKAECEDRVGNSGLLTTNKVDEVIGHIKRSTYAQRSVLNREKWTVNLRNGLLDIKTRELRPHRSDCLCTIRIPLAYNPAADCPHIKQFFAEVLHPEHVPVIEELFGYCLIPDYRFSKAFLFVGPGSNGKTTMLNLLTAFIGQDNISNVSLHTIEQQRFAIARLEGKLVNFFDELPARALMYTQNFKVLTGGGPIGAERKFKEGFSYVNFARLIFSCNRPPRIEDEDSYAFWRRWIYIDFPNTFKGQNEDKDLITKLTTPDELSGLLNLALDGLERLFTNQEFSYKPSVAEVAETYIKASDPVQAFLDECCELDEGSAVERNTLYKRFDDYCRRRQLPVLTVKAFGSRLRNLSRFAIRPDRESKGERRYIYRGVRLLTDDEIADRSGSDVYDVYNHSYFKGDSEVNMQVKIAKTIDTVDDKADHKKTVDDHHSHNASSPGDILGIESQQECIKGKGLCSLRVNGQKPSSYALTRPVLQAQQPMTEQHIRLSDGRILNWQWCQLTWTKLGKPCMTEIKELDISLYLYPERLSPQKRQLIVDWLEKHSGEKMADDVQPMNMGIRISSTESNLKAGMAM